MGIRFDMIDLRLFVHVVEAGSITAGAERCHLSLASASARVQGMENTLGTPLLERSRRGVALTAAGQVLFQHARGLLLQAQRMTAELGDFAQGLRGHVRLFCNSAASHEHLPELLPAYLLRHPAVNIEVVEALGERIVQAVLEGSADIGLVVDTTPTYGLETRPFRRDRLVIVAPLGHPLGQQGPDQPISIIDGRSLRHRGPDAGQCLARHLGRARRAPGCAPELPPAPAELRCAVPRDHPRPGRGADAGDGRPGARIEHVGAGAAAEGSLAQRAPRAHLHEDLRGPADPHAAPGGAPEPHDLITGQIQFDDPCVRARWCASGAHPSERRITVPVTPSRSFEAANAAESLVNGQCRAHLALITQGDTQAFQAFYKATVAHMWPVAVRILGRSQQAEDALSELYLQVWRQADRFDPERSTPLAWLAMICRSRAIDQLRKVDHMDYREDMAVLIDQRDPEHADASWGSTPEPSASTGKLDAALATLPALRRQLITMAYFHGLSHTELATHFELPLGTVKGHMRAALAALRSHIDERKA
jgi:RNA polymerase sigma factor (sigma-70 family)